MVCKVTNMFWVGVFFRDKTTRRAYHFTLTHTDTHVQTHTLSHTHPTKAHTHSLIHSHTHTHTHSHTQTLLRWHFGHSKVSCLWKCPQFRSVLICTHSHTRTHTHTHTHAHTHTHTHTHSFRVCINILSFVLMKWCVIVYINTWRHLSTSHITPH